MATQGYLETFPSGVLAGTAVCVSWVLNAGDKGEPFDLAGFADRSVQIVGDPLGSTVVFQGALVTAPTDADYATLNDAFGDPLSLTAAGLHAVAEAVRWIRPVVTGGAAANLPLHLLALGR